MYLGALRSPVDAALYSVDSAYSLDHQRAYFLARQGECVNEINRTSWKVPGKMHVDSHDVSRFACIPRLGLVEELLLHRFFPLVDGVSAAIIPTFVMNKCIVGEAFRLRFEVARLLSCEVARDRRW